MGLPGIVWMFVILIVARWYGTLLVLDGSIVSVWLVWLVWLVVAARHILDVQQQNVGKMRDVLERKLMQP